jgi:hypothetical protein
MLDYVAFANVLGGEDRRAVRRKAKRKDPPGGVGRGCMTLVGTCKINLPTLCQHGGVGGQDEPAERQEGTRKQGTGVHDE